MNKTFLLGMFVMLGVFMVSGAYAFDQDTPYTVTVNFIVPSDTTFTVSLAGAETTVDFNDNVAVGSGTQTEVEPDSQNASTSVPIINITNAGNLNLNFTTNLTTSKPSWVTLKVSNDTVYGSSTSFDTTAVLVEENVPSGNSVSMYLWSDLDRDSWVQGTTARTLQINSVDNS